MNLYKTALHVHTRNSDGVDPLNSDIEEHYRKKYDLLAVTDHGYLTRDWVSASKGLTQERFDEIASGVDRDGRFMLQIPYTTERSSHDHLNTFFATFVEPYQFLGRDAEGHDVDIVLSGTADARVLEEKLEQSLQQTESQGGLSHLNHPGRYTLGYSDLSQSNNPVHIDKYVEVFMTYSTCVGMEIINKKDGESRNDRILWDNINARTIPQGRYVWGFSNDDTHSNSDTGFSYNMMVFMPENTLPQFRVAMVSGSFYAVAHVAWNEGVNNLDLGRSPPVISDISVDTGTITLTASHYDRIEWITEGTVKVAEGPTIRPAEVAGVGVFVRANVIGPGGIAFTRPFGV